MRYGVCIGNRGSEFVEIIKRCNYDYIEGKFCNIQDMEEKTFREFINAVNEYDINFEAFNSFFPKTSDVTLVGDNAAYLHLNDFFKTGFERCAKLGGKIIVIGSGKSRIIPDGFDREKAKEQYASFLTFCGDMALEYGMNIVIEPLNRGETNFINTVDECIDICKYTSHKNVFALADFFHMFKNGETLEGVENAGEMLKHVHIARANDDRAQPTLPEDRDVCTKWAEALKKCGYNSRISLESRYVPDFETAIQNARPVFDLF